MASVRRVGKKYLAEVRRKGRYKSKRFDTKAAAQAWALEVEQQLGVYPEGQIGHTMRDALQKYADEVSPTRKGARWEQVRITKFLRDPLADRMLMDMRREDIEDWMRRQTISSSSIRRELNLISAVLKQARVVWRWMAHNPMQDVVKPKKGRNRERLISDAERDRILLALGHKDAPPENYWQQVAIAFLLALETGMRQGEIFGLEWPHVHAHYVHLPDTKNGMSRDVALSTRARQLMSYLKDQPRPFTVNQATAGQIFRRAVQLAEIKGVTFHDTRHTAVTRLARKLDMLDLARMVGHRDPRSLMGYYHPTAADIARRLD